MFIDIREIERERQTDRQTDINQVSPIYTPTEDRTHNPGMYPDLTRVRAPQPTEPPGQGSSHFFKSVLLTWPHLHSGE